MSFIMFRNGGFPVRKVLFLLVGSVSKMFGVLSVQWLMVVPLFLVVQNIFRIVGYYPSVETVLITMINHG